MHVLEAIYQEDFLGLSYGYRPGRGQHDALDALHAGIYRKQVNWVLARNSHTTVSAIGVQNRTKTVVPQQFMADLQRPEARQSVAEISLDLNLLKAARW